MRREHEEVSGHVTCVCHRRKCFCCPPEGKELAKIRSEERRKIRVMEMTVFGIGCSKGVCLEARNSIRNHAHPDVRLLPDAMCRMVRSR